MLLFRARAALTISPWIVLLFLFPFAAPLLRVMAATLPDAGFRKVLGARLTVQDVALRLIADHRRVLAQVAALEGLQLVAAWCHCNRVCKCKVCRQAVL